jgi:hypothetical protein
VEPTSVVTLFALPTPNPRHRPPDHDGPVAIWHATRGLIRGRRIGHSWHALEPSGPIALLAPREVLGWWPDPKPIPDRIVRCAGCGLRVAVPLRPTVHGGLAPDHGEMPDGWRYDPRPGPSRTDSPWKCPDCFAPDPREAVP